MEFLFYLKLLLMKGNKYKCRIFKRLFLFVATISIVPFTVIYLVANEHFYRIKSYNYGISNNFSRHIHRPITTNTSNFLQVNLDVEGLKHRMDHRIQHMNEKCSEFKLNDPDTQKPKSWEYLINHEHHLVWCNIFKAASTSWMYNFNILAGYTALFLKKTKDVPLELARKKYPRPSVDELLRAMNESISFMIVRHPFERLASAYKDKIQYALPHSHHHKLGNRIIQRFRLHKRPGMRRDIPHKNTRYPSFSEFVYYMFDEVKITRSEIDMHWAPITNFCTPCHFHYDVIAKFETLNEDQNYLIHLAKLGHIIKPQWKNAGKGSQTSEIVTKLFSELTDEQLNGLYEYYKYDFLLFDYNFNSYLNHNQVQDVSIS